MPTLEQMGDAVRDGHPPQLAPETHAQLIETIREAEALTKPKETPSAADSPAKEPETPKAQPWY
jgi:hypothetical protein